MSRGTPPPRPRDSRRREERRTARAITLGIPRRPRARNALLLQLERDLLAEPRPVTRGDCVDGERPCPFVSCRHHLYLDVNPETGSVKINFPFLELDELPAVHKLCPPEAGCWMCGGDFRGGPPLTELGERVQPQWYQVVVTFRTEGDGIGSSRSAPSPISPASSSSPISPTRRNRCHVVVAATATTSARSPRACTSRRSTRRRAPARRSSSPRSSRISTARRKTRR